MNGNALLESGASDVFAIFRRRSCWIGLGTGILTLFVGVTFFLSSSIENSVLQRGFASKQAGSKDSFCHHSMWGYGCQRVDEMRRIFDSVKTELSTAAEKLDEANRELEAVTKEIPNKQQELQDIERRIEEARRVLKEVNDKHNVRVFLPREPLWPVEKSEGAFGEERKIRRGLSLDEDFDFGRCSITTGFRFFLYDAHSDHLLHQELSVHPNRLKDAKKVCLLVAFVSKGHRPSDLQFWKKDGRNHLLIALGTENVDFQKAIVLGDEMIHSRSPFHISAFLDVPGFDKMNDWQRYVPLLPHNRKVLLAYKGNLTLPELEDLRKSAGNSGDAVDFSPEADLKNAVFTLILPMNSSSFQRNIYEALLVGSIPVILDSDAVLPFDDLIDWRLISMKISKWRFSELHFILRTVPLNDILEMRRMGRIFLENYLGNAQVLSRTLISAIRWRLGLPSDSLKLQEAIPLFNGSFQAPQIAMEPKPRMEDEFLGPIEAPSDSPMFLHNFTSMSLYSYDLWNKNPYAVHSTMPYLANNVLMPSGVEFHEDTNTGFRPISPGSGKEFSEALGGNRPKEQFTIVMVTHNRDSVLSASLERLRDLPYLNKVIVVWNNVDRDPPSSWPRIHVPIEFIRAKTNSLNNRFIPYDRIQTEAILSMDDDIDLRKDEIIANFRVWREERQRIVGFPARYQARFGENIFYNSNHTCQYSMILTGAAFIHQSYLDAYTNHMQAIIRSKVDEWMNCEDIAMNFLVSHLYRKPPIKVTSKWTLRCPTCTETLSNDESHFTERHNCIRFFTEVYGYDPLLFTQSRTDSVLFKTRLPPDHQKCFKYV